MNSTSFSFMKALGETAQKSTPSPIKKSARGIGSTDTAYRNLNVVALVDDKHFDAMLLRQQAKTRAQMVSNASSQYLLDDTKSHVGAHYEQKTLVRITREVIKKDQRHTGFGMVASNV
jgi:hypothetical protein